MSGETKPLLVPFDQPSRRRQIQRQIAELEGELTVVERRLGRLSRQKEAAESQLRITTRRIATLARGM